jgi:hypothetical protein
VTRELTQVAVVPGRLDAAKEARRVGVAVPPDAEPVSVRRRRAEAGMQALVDERVVRLAEELSRRIGDPE